MSTLFLGIACAFLLGAISFLVRGLAYAWKDDELSDYCEEMMLRYSRVAALFFIAYIMAR